MSDTPRTDDEMVEMITGDGPVKTKTRWVHWTACATIERELSAANERIRRLEEAGDKLHWAFMHPFDPARYDLPKLWIEAKAKP